MASLVAGLASFPRPPSDPPDLSFKFALRSNPPDPPVPPDPPPDILSFMGFLQLYDLWATVGFPHKFSDPKLCLTISDGGLASGKDLFFPDGTVFVLTPLYQVSSDSLPYASECDWIIDVLVELVLLDLRFSVNCFGCIWLCYCGICWYLCGLCVVHYCSMQMLSFYCSMQVYCHLCSNGF
ncbi:unnamed protein product [Brassica oleracea]